MRTLIFCIISASYFSLYAQGGKKALESLNGTYASTGSEDWGRGTFGYREFTFQDGKWSLNFILALDPNLNTKVFEFRTFGTYKILRKSNVGKGVFEALFYEEKKFVTLRTDNQELIKGFGLAGCGLIKDSEKDISEDGCAIWPSVEECNEDHDLLKLDGNELFFGMRPADNNMCSPDKRPNALLPAVIKL